MEILPILECNAKWKLTGHKRSTKNNQKTLELPFAHIKQNIKLHELKTRGIENTSIEFKLYTLGHNLKRTYDGIQTKNN